MTRMRIQRKLLLVVIALGSQCFAMHDSGLPTLTLDTGSARRSGLWNNLIETTDYKVSVEMQEAMKLEVCLAKVAQPEAVADLFAVWTATAAHPCHYQKVPQQNVSLLRLGRLVSKSGKVMGAGGGKVRHVYQAEDADTNQNVGQIQLITDYSRGVLREYTLTALSQQTLPNQEN